MPKVRVRAAPPPSEAVYHEMAQLFQPLSPRELTVEDGRQIVFNLSGAFGLLLKWKKAKVARERGDSSPAAEGAP